MRTDSLLKLAGLDGARIMPALTEKAARASGSGLATVRAGMPRCCSAYSGPEVMLGGEIGFEADVWSIGCIVYQLATGEERWDKGLRGVKE